MKKIFTLLTLAVAALGLMLPHVSPRALADTYYDPYDPETEGVVSGYLCVDREAGYIRGIAPGIAF